MITQIVIIVVPSLILICKDCNVMLLSSNVDGLFICRYGLGFQYLFFHTTMVFPAYLFYWVVMFISLWYQWSNDRGFWYHDLAFVYVITIYFC